MITHVIGIVIIGVFGEMVFGRFIGRKIFRPYQFNDAMYVIRHYYIFVQNGMRKMIWYFQPTFAGDFTCIVQNHLMIDYITE